MIFRQALAEIIIALFRSYETKMPINWGEGYLDQVSIIFSTQKQQFDLVFFVYS